MTKRARGWWMVLSVPLVVLLMIAGSDRLFTRTVPVEQRLISHNDDIRKKAQQELLGQSQDQKKESIDRLIPVLTQGDPSARKWAAISLALVGPAAQAAIPALLECVSDREKDVSQAARVALTEIGAPDPAQLPQLIQALGDPREPVRCEAASSVAKLGPTAEPAVSPLMNIVTRDAPLPGCMAASLATLNDFLPQVEVGLVDALRSSDAVVRRHAAEVLSRVPGKSSSTVSVLLTVLADDTDAAVRSEVAVALTLNEAPDRGREPTFAAAVHEASDAVVRFTAFELLKTVPTSVDAFRAVLVRMLHDEDPELRQAALEWVRSQPSLARKLVRPLVGCLKDPVARHRRLALNALYQIPLRQTDWLPIIAKMQRDEDPDVRCLAVRQLVDMGGADRVAIHVLTGDLKQGEDPVCAVGALALAGHFNPDVIPEVLPLLEGPDPIVRSRAAAVFLQLGAKARPALPGLMKAQREHVPGAENALRVIRQALARDHGRRR